jgi:hypothetical protein
MPPTVKKQVAGSSGQKDNDREKKQTGIEANKFEMISNNRNDREDGKKNRVNKSRFFQNCLLPKAKNLTALTLF